MIWAALTLTAVVAFTLGYLVARDLAEPWPEDEAPATDEPSGGDFTRWVEATPWVRDLMVDAEADQQQRMRVAAKAIGDPDCTLRIEVSRGE